jgi:hypothetical protein
MLIQGVTIRNIKSKVCTIYPSVFRTPEVKNDFERFHEEFVLVLSDKACLCKAHYYNCIVNELGINSTFGNPYYTPTALSKDGILQNHRSVLNTFNMPANGMN